MVVQDQIHVCQVDLKVRHQWRLYQQEVTRLLKDQSLKSIKHLSLIQLDTLKDRVKARDHLVQFN